MRSLKFRAWDIKNNRFVNIVRLVFDQFGALDYAEVVFKGKIYKLYPSEIVLEQDTGLKDKNGKEIHEGDIVALLFGYVPMKSVTTENIRIENAQKAVIHFDTVRAAFRYTIKLRTPKDCQFKPGAKTNMVVIGNIHENKELLGGEG